MKIQEKFMRILLSLLAICLFSCSGIQSRYHEVGAGDTLDKIAQRYEITVSDLQTRNRPLLAKGLVPGSKLYIPFEANPKWNDEYTTVSREINETAESNPVAYKMASAQFTWPVRGGRLSSGFGKRHRGMHEGIDIAANRGTPIIAARSGHVIYSGNKIRGYGNLVIIRHADSYSTVYAHLSKMKVKKGQFVARGQVIGSVGRTGRATGNHLHFEIRNHRVAVNPLFYLQTQVAANTLGR